MIARSNLRAVLLRSCAPIALAVLALPNVAQAQAFGASPNVVQGTVNIDRTVIGVDTITVDGTDAVIDWTPETGSGGIPLTFLPSGNIAHYRGAPDATTFAVLNRVLSTGLDPVMFDGLVDAFLTNANGGTTTPGGLVAFYSPSGILVGPTARFDVPQLVLTTHAVDVASFAEFAGGTGPLALSGQDGPRIIINNGAVITGAAEGSYFVVAAPSIEMDGTASINGSTVYVASNAVELTHSSGLFDITITTGTQSRVPIFHTGITGGPSSTGSGDAHVIYAVARTGVGALPAEMLFSRSLGFEPASSAGVVNGDIILSANYDVSGRTVDGGENRLGADSAFGGRDPVIYSPLTLDINFLNATSNLLAIGTHVTRVTGSNDFTSDLVVVGREQALVNSTADTSIEVGGDLFVSASNYRNRNVTGSAFDATGGFASVFAEVDSRVSVAGRTNVNADAFAGGTSGPPPLIGSATGGQAQILAGGGLIDLTGDTRVSANAGTDLQGLYPVSGDMSAGRAEFLVTGGGTTQLFGGLSVTANAVSPDLLGTGAQGGGDARGGIVLIGVGSDGGTLDIRLATYAEASGIAGSSSALTGTGGTGEGGRITVSAIEGGEMNFGLGTTPGSRVQLVMQAQGGTMNGGTGGVGRAGRIEVSAIAASANFGGDLTLSNGATGGRGTDGGDADGEAGISTVLADNSPFTVGGALDISLSLAGGRSNGTGNGGDASGGEASLRMLDESVLDVTGSTAIKVSASGGNSSQINAGSAVSGNATIEVSGASQANLASTSITTQAKGGDTDDGTGGTGEAAASLLRIGTDASVTILGALYMEASGLGGTLLSNGIGTGGAGTGGFVTVDATGTDSQLQVGDAATLFSAGFGGFEADGTGGSVTISANGGSVIGIGGSTLMSAQGTSGDIADTPASGFGGTARVNATASLIDFVGALIMSAGGEGSTGPIGGFGEGGDVAVMLSDSTVSVNGDFRLSADGYGGAGQTEGGSALGGSVSLDVTQGSEFTLGGGIRSLSASAFGGNVPSGDGGDAEAGSAQVRVNGATADLGASFVLSAIAEGGDTEGDGGAATGGTVRLEGLGGAVLEVGALTFDAHAQAGNTTSDSSGDAAGGLAQIDLSGTELDAGNVTVMLDGVSPGGSATAGDFAFIVGDGVDAGLTGLDVLASAIAGNGAAAGGTARIEIVADTSSSLNIANVEMTLSAQSGPDEADSTAGQFLIRADSGRIGTQDVDITALGSASNATDSEIAATGGDILIEDNLDVTLKGDLVLRTDSGSKIIGGETAANPGALFNIRADGTITIIGNDPATPSLVSAQLNLTSRDIDLSPQANARANSIRLTSMETRAGRTAVIGGTTDGSGYTLTQAEADRLSGNSLQINLPALLRQQGPNDPTIVDAELRGLTLRGTQGSGYSSVLIGSDANLHITGQLTYADAGILNRLDVIAARALVIALGNGAGIAIKNTNGGLSGELDIRAGSLIAASPALATTILNNPGDPTIAGLLASDGGALVADPYLEAAGIALVADDYILMQNTGAGGVLGGILVGDEGLLIRNDSDAGIPLRVIAYGAHSTAGGLITDNEFFDEAIAGNALTGPFTDDATLNDCFINDAICAILPDEEDNIIGEITNHVPIEEPLAPDDDAIMAAAEDLFFGADFPSLVDLPLISEEGMVGDPVTSGADSAANTSDEDEDEDDAS